MIRVILVLMAGITSISFAAIFIKYCNDVPAIMIAAYRLSIASVILVSLHFLKGGRQIKVEKKDLALSLVAGLFLSLHFITWISSLKFTSVASSVVLVTTNPIFVGIFSWLFLRERQNLELVTGIILCFAGSAMIASGDGGVRSMIMVEGTALRGDILALIGAVMASGYLLIGSKVRERLDILTYVTIVFSISAMILVIVSLLLGIPFTGYRPASYFFMFLLAVVPQLIGHTSINWALKHLKASMVAISILGEPIGAAILAYIFFGESVKNYQYVGMVLIFAAIIIASRKGLKARP